MWFSWVWKGWSWWEIELVNVSYPIPYSFLRQDAAVAWTTFYGIAGLKSLANHQLRLYHTHKVWYGSADEGLIECGKAHEWFTDYSTSKLVTVCKGGHLRDTMRGRSRLSSQSFLIFTLQISCALYFNFFLIPLLSPSPHKPFSMWLRAVTAFSTCLSQ